MRDYGHYAKYYYLTEVFRSWEGPWFVGAYVEHKNVFGMTVRLSVNNIFNGRHLLRPDGLFRLPRPGADRLHPEAATS